MIKLFWNTHNQIVDNPKESKEENSRIRKWGIYHKENSSKWIFKILSKIQFKTIESYEKIQSNDRLIIIDSSIEKKVELYSRLKLVCSKIFLIHLGDEAGSNEVSLVYENCTNVLRTFCSNKYFNNDKIKCIPLGFKSGVSDQQIKKRKYKWTFIGTPHKSSRHDLLFQLSNIKPFFSHKTRKFNENTISVDEMNKALSSTFFVPCPNGFVHPETYRLYEALECGCIPIVENTYKYYDRLFPNNPFIKINKWSEASSIIYGWKKEQVEKKRDECKLWWKEYKTKLQVIIKEIVNS